MLDDVTTEGVGEVDDGIDAMPEEAPDQPEVAQPAAPAEPVAPGEEAPTAFSLEGVTPEQAEAWKKDSENRHNWQKTNTQEAQRIAEGRRTLAYQQQQVQAFQNDPVTQALWAARQRLEQNPALLADVERFNAGTAQPGQQPDPLVNQLFGEVQTLKEQMARDQWQTEEQARGEAALAATTEVETFRAEHAEAFPEGDEGDAAFKAFYDNVYVPTGVVKLATAWKIHDYDGAQARARQTAQGEVAAVDGEKAAAASTVVPGSHTPEVWTGDRDDYDFSGARERSRSRYNLGLTKD